MGVFDQMWNNPSPNPVTEDLKLAQSGITENDGFHVPYFHYKKNLYNDEHVLTSVIIKIIFPLKQVFYIVYKEDEVFKWRPAESKMEISKNQRGNFLNFPLGKTPKTNHIYIKSCIFFSLMHFLT